MFEFKVGDIVKVIDNTRSLNGCGIELGAIGEVESYLSPYQILIKIDDYIFLVCYDEIELSVRGLK